MKTNGSIKKKPNTFAHEIQVNTPRKTLVEKPVLSLILSLKILGSHPRIWPIIGLQCCSE
jgi:hypothetical protein